MKCALLLALLAAGASAFAPPPAGVVTTRHLSQRARVLSPRAPQPKTVLPAFFDQKAQVLEEVPAAEEAKAVFRFFTRNLVEDYSGEEQFNVMLFLFHG